MSDPALVGLLGFGEVGQALSDDLHRAGIRLRAWDILFPALDSAPSRAVSVRPFVDVVGSASQLAAGCSLVICAVTAAEDETAIASIAAGLPSGCFLMDLNSVAPSTRRRCADITREAGARYVEAAVMSPIHPLGIASPVLLGGSDADPFLPLARSIGFSGASVCSHAIGIASATKMCRSVIVKGLEALFTESMLAARHYGVEDEVLESLHDMLASRPPRELAHYMISRSVEHGARRAEEMREVARTVSDADVEPWMSLACAKRQDWAANFPSALEQARLPAMLDSIRSASKC